MNWPWEVIARVKFEDGFETTVLAYTKDGCEFRIKEIVERHGKCIGCTYTV